MEFCGRQWRTLDYRRERMTKFCELLERSRTWKSTRTFRRCTSLKRLPIARWIGNCGRREPLTGAAIVRLHTISAHVVASLLESHHHFGRTAFIRLLKSRRVCHTHGMGSSQVKYAQETGRGRRVKIFFQAGLPDRHNSLNVPNSNSISAQETALILSGIQSFAFANGSPIAAR